MKKKRPLTKHEKILIISSIFALSLLGLCIFYITHPNKYKDDSYKLEMWYKRLTHDKRPALVTCDNCGISKILISYPYGIGYHIYKNKVFYCGEEAPNFNLLCKPVEINRRKIKIFNEYFARDNKNIYCGDKIVGDYHGQKIGYNIYDDGNTGNLTNYIADKNYFYGDMGKARCEKIKNPDPNFLQKFRNYK